MTGCLICGGETKRFSNGKYAKYCRGVCVTRRAEANKCQIAYSKCLVCGKLRAVRTVRDIPETCGQKCCQILANSRKRNIPIGQWQALRPMERNGHTHKKRCKKYGRVYRLIDRFEIFKRDSWTCGICGRMVDPEARYPAAESASIDHVVPISLGGDHVESNVQCAHLRCNLAKHNRVA